METPEFEGLHEEWRWKGSKECESPERKEKERGQKGGFLELVDWNEEGTMTTRARD
jgi:hypothetical protein